MTETRVMRVAAGAVAVWLALALFTGPGVAQVPGEIEGVEFSGPTTLEWDPFGAYDSFNLYRGGLSDFADGLPARCREYGIIANSVELPVVPESGEGFFYLVAGQRPAGEGSKGLDFAGQPRVVLGECVPLMRNHLLDRLGYGWDEWTSDRVQTLGFDGYIAEQLDPSTISESGNALLNGFLSPIDPPVDIFQLVQQQMVRGVYARRQLEQQVATFWFNHFNTDWQKIAEIFQGVYPECESPGVPVQCDPNYPAKAYAVAAEVQYDDVENFRNLGFNGNFREMVEDASVSIGMIIYLDTYLSVGGNPNENFPRELLELHTRGVDCGYTQLDIEELSRVITGWSGCKKLLADVDDPLAPCIPEYWLDTPAGKWVAAFVPQNHDCTVKTLFAGTPYETTIPDTCSAPLTGVDDLYLALDAIVDHPCTAEFISRKVLQRFVTDEPDQALVDAIVSVWNDAGNPQGVGDLKAVLEAALNSELFLNPENPGGKIKTPLEYLVSAFRATRGITDGLEAVVGYLVSMGHIPHFNPVPTGWPEDGGSWIGTNNTLDRQNFAFDLFDSVNAVFSADPLALLNDNGVSTAPGNAEAIVNFFADTLFGTALTPAERQAAIDYLETDDFGNPSTYNDDRILEAIAVLMGYPQFQEQ